MENLEKKKSKKKGCLIVLAVSIAIAFVFLAILVSIAKKNSEKAPNQTEKVTTAEDQELEKLKDLDVLSKKIEKSKRNFTEQYDDIEGITWIYPKSKPTYANTKAFFVYLGLSDKGQVWKRLVVRYHGDDWLFLQNIIIKTDNKTYTLNASNSERDHNADVWEWIDVAPTAVEDVIINDVMNSKATKVRFSGKQYYNDWTLTAKEIKGLKDINDYYSLLKQTYDLKHTLN